jgi:hypothetical protein
MYLGYGICFIKSCHILATLEQIHYHDSFMSLVLSVAAITNVNVFLAQAAHQ